MVLRGAFPKLEFHVGFLITQQSSSPRLFLNTALFFRCRKNISWEVNFCEFAQGFIEFIHSRGDVFASSWYSISLIYRFHSTLFFFPSNNFPFPPFFFLLFSFSFFSPCNMILLTFFFSSRVFSFNLPEFFFLFWPLSKTYSLKSAVSIVTDWFFLFSVW